jgi:RNA polymerase sigma-70 factor (ECF subfamily)
MAGNRGRRRAQPHSPGMLTVSTPIPAMRTRFRDATADDLLARYAACGDAAALEQLVARLRDDALRVARARVGAGEAEDVVQATFLAVLDHAADGFRPGSDARAWIMTIVVNACRMRQRGAEARARHERAAAADVVVADGGVRAAEAREELVAAVASIDEPFRSAVELRYLRGLEYAAVARALDVPLKTARSRVARGIAELRRRLRGRACASLVLVVLGAGRAPAGIPARARGGACLL